MPSTVTRVARSGFRSADVCVDGVCSKGRVTSDKGLKQLLLDRNRSQRHTPRQVQVLLQRYSVQRAGIKMVHLPYRSTIAAATALVNNEASCNFGGQGVVWPLVEGPAGRRHRGHRCRA